jgi:iron complex transport system substrate-binding protein
MSPIDFYPRRIVCLQPSVSVTLAALKCLDRVVACTKYCLDVVPELKTLQVDIVADSWTANCQQILETRPDLVLASVPYQIEAVCDILKAGVRFLGFAPHSLADVFADTVYVGALVGRPEAAEKIVRSMQAEIASVSTRVQAAGRPLLRVFCEEWGRPIIASQSWAAELAEAAGGRFVVEPGKTVSAPEILSLDPDVLIAAWCGAGDRCPLEKIVSQRNWQTIRAVRDRRVYCIRDEYLNTPALTLLQGLHSLAAAFHPDLFPDFEAPRRI